VLVKGVDLPDGGRIAAVEPPSLRLEFYGDSITSGYSLDCDCESGDAAYKDHYDSYAALVTRELGAWHHSISLSGLGVTRSYWDGDVLDYWDGQGYGDHAWDFSKWPADIVVIDLGQNDYSLGAGAEMVDAYVDFVDRMRAVHPHAAIFLVIGSMSAVGEGSPFPDYVRAAVATVNAAGDTNVYAYVFPEYAPAGHPHAAEHRAMADDLLAYLREVLPDLAR
jgi:lysophospholipase L1-like esterase